MLYIRDIRTFTWLVILFLAVSPLSPKAAPDWNFEKLLMPGKLIEGHAEYEDDCSNCHVSFEKASQDDLCLDCHEEVAVDVVRKTGFHGRVVSSAKGECKGCHVDHQGRQKVIVQLDTDRFDHQFTNFSLTGKHLKVSCGGCHATGEKHRGARGECVDCHKEDDRHGDSLGADCVSCHTEESWGKTNFDHSTTRFTLRGKHEDVSCSTCHPGERYKDIGIQCQSCHTINDVHEGSHGPACQDCHSEKKWSETLFDHDEDTDFHLRGEHNSLECDACHKRSPEQESPGKLCIDCHQADDAHTGRNGEQCSDCHGESSWSEIRFDHKRDTEFALMGRHRELPCGVCHSGPLYEERLQTDCVACHAFTDVHRGQQGQQCSNCHNEESWHQDVVFDHDLTDFPLIGLHATVPCEECHLSDSFKGTTAVCEACHRRNDEHSGTLGPDCFSCHNPAGWEFWRFDHDTQTDYPLEGAHENLVCDACHRQRVKNKVRQSSACVSCHQNDDIHGGGYGNRCERCHASDSFNNIEKLLH